MKNTENKTWQEMIADLLTEYGIVEDNFRMKTIIFKSKEDFIKAGSGVLRQIGRYSTNWANTKMIFRSKTTAVQAATKLRKAGFIFTQE